MILVFYFMSSILDFRLNYSQSIRDKRLFICSFIESLIPIVTFAIRAKFFTIPIFWPYGVSDGQIIPKCVLWSSLGLADFELD